MFHLFLFFKFFFIVALSTSKLCFLCWLAASPWLSKIGQVQQDSGASLIQFDRTAGGWEFDQLIKREQRYGTPPHHPLHPLKVVQTPLPMLHLFLLCSCTYYDKICVLYWKGTRLHFLFMFHCTDQAAGRSTAWPGSAAWKSYSVTFFSRCAEVEIWALWTCLLVENRFLRRPVKLLLLETWLTIRHETVQVSLWESEINYTVSPVGRRVVYVYVCVKGGGTVAKTFIVCWKKFPLWF